MRDEPPEGNVMTNRVLFWMWRMRPLLVLAVALVLAACESGGSGGSKY